MKNITTVSLFVSLFLACNTKEKEKIEPVTPPPILNTIKEKAGWVAINEPPFNGRVYVQKDNLVENEKFLKYWIMLDSVSDDFDNIHYDNLTKYLLMSENRITGQIANLSVRKYTSDSTEVGLSENIDTLYHYASPLSYFYLIHKTAKRVYRIL